MIIQIWCIFLVAVIHLCIYLLFSCYIFIYILDKRKSFQEW